jgi:hypothetical protein
MSSDIVEEAKKQIQLIDDGFDMDLGYIKHPPYEAPVVVTPQPTLPVPESAKVSPPTKTTMPDKLRETVIKSKVDHRRDS